MKKIFKKSFGILFLLFVFFVVPNFVDAQVVSQNNLTSNFTLTIQVKGNYPVNSSVKIGQVGSGIQFGDCTANVNTGSVCTFKTIPNNTNVKLTALFANEAKFSKWEGACTGTNDVCDFVLDSDKNISAFFDKKVNATVGGGNTNSGSTGNNSQNQSGSNSSSSGSSSSSGLVPCSGAEDCGWNNLLVLINNIVKFILFRLAVPIAAIMFAYAGILLLTSGGDPAQKTKAKKIFTGVAIGVIIAAAAWIIVHFIVSLLGCKPEFCSWIGF